jgi:hypothetical protein
MTGIDVLMQCDHEITREVTILGITYDYCVECGQYFPIIARQPQVDREEK